MILKLDNSDDVVAQQIYRVFQCSYKIEADLIGTSNFPPLSRSATDIAQSSTCFYGFVDNQCLAAVIEIAYENHHLEIHSLTVDPQFFRKGIAAKVMEYILDLYEYSEAIVETAVVNIPAIKLYQKYGFVEFKQWTPAHGIPKVAMLLESTAS